MRVDRHRQAASIATLATVAVLFASIAGAQVKHGAEIDQVCSGPVAVDPSGEGIVRPGDPFQCSVRIRNADEFGHSLRVTSVVACVNHASGKTCTENLLPGSSQGTCFGGAKNTSPCNMEADCLGGKCGVVLAEEGDVVIVSTSDVVQEADATPLLVTANGDGLDEGAALDFALTITTPLRIIANAGAAGGATIATAPRAGSDRHGAEIRKGCAGPGAVDPDRVGVGRPGDLVTCNIHVTNKDDFGHAVRVNSVVDALSHADGPTVTANLLPGVGVCDGLAGGVSCTRNEDCGAAGRCSIGSTCVGGADAGSPCQTKDDCTEGSCSISPQCLGGQHDGDPCTKQSDCPSPGACTVTLHVRDDVVVVSHSEAIRQGDPDPLPDTATADAVDLGALAVAQNAAVARVEAGATNSATGAGGLGLIFGALVQVIGQPNVPTPTATATPTAPSVCGDADGNGSVTVTDGVVVLRAAAGLPTSCTASRCDLDGNGTVSVTDGVKVLRRAAGLRTTANCPL